MEWNNHWRLEGKHSVLSPSNSAWQRYDADKMRRVFDNGKQKERGTILHELASTMIKTRTKAMEGVDKALYMFVNDAIMFRMKSEMLLYYSDNCFGTADAISFDEKHKLLRIFDLKTGRTKVTFDQLYAYAALFCLEYNQKPEKLDFNFRIYQGFGYEEENIDKGDGVIIRDIMNKIVELDGVLVECNEEYIKNGGF